MLRYQPTSIDLTMADVDLACYRLAMRKEASTLAAPLPRVRRGARRSCEEALTHQTICSFGSSALPLENVQEAGLRLPRYRKDLTKLGVPAHSKGQDVATLSRESNTMTLDGIDETIHDSGHVDTRSRSTDPRQSEQSTYATSPLRDSHAPKPSDVGSHGNQYEWPTEASHVAQTNARGYQGRPTREPYAIAAMRIRSSQDLFASAAGSLRQMYRPQPQNLLRPPITRLSSLSSPNLTSNAMELPTIHSRNASTGAAPTQSTSLDSADYPSFLTPRAVSMIGEQPMLEVMRHYASPLADLEQRFHAMSDHASSRSNSSFYTARTQSRARSQVRFPSFDSPPKRQNQSTDLRRVPQIILAEPSGNVAHEPSETPTTWEAEVSPSSVHIRPITLLPPQEIDSVAVTHGPSRPANPTSNVCPRPRNDSGVSVSFDHRQHTEMVCADDNKDDALYFNIPTLDDTQSPGPSSSSFHRSFPVFSPSFDGADDYSRYPDPRLVLNRRSMPTPSSSTRPPTDSTQPSRRPERPYSHGARPRGDTQRTTHPSAETLKRSGPSRSLFDDRMPPRPSAPPQLPRRPHVTAQPNQENDGSAEEEMMRHELAQLQLRGGADGQRRSNENAPAPAGRRSAFVLDDTPPGEGRFERFLRE